MVNRQSSKVLKFNRQPWKKVIFYRQPSKMQIILTVSSPNVEKTSSHVFKNTLSRHKKTLNLARKGQDNLQNT